MQRTNRSFRRKRMIGIYLSGTGNTIHCIEKLMELLDQSAQTIPIEGKETATMGLFSGDGAGCSARLLKKYGAKVVGGLHIHMPDSVCDVKLLKKSIEKNREIIKAADRKIENCASKMKQGKYPKDGLYFYDRIAGLICQRLWCHGKTKDYSLMPCHSAIYRHSQSGSQFRCHATGDVCLFDWRCAADTSISAEIERGN